MPLILEEKLRDLLELFYSDNVLLTKKLPKYFDAEEVINKKSRDFGKKIKGTDTGLAADLFSEEEIEELKERMEHGKLLK